MEPIIKASSNLPSNLQFILLLSIVLVLALLTIISHFVSLRKDKLRNDNQSAILSQISKTESQFSQLIELLYEKFANTLTLDIAANIIRLCYIRTTYTTVDKIISLVCDECNRKNGKIDTTKISIPLFEYTSNRYYEEAMFLNKLKCKNLPIDTYHSSKVSPEFISNTLLIIIERYDNNDKEAFRTHITTEIHSFFTTLANKNIMYLEKTLTL